MISGNTEKYVSIESFGVKISVWADREELREEIASRVEQFLPKGSFREISPSRAVHRFSVRQNNQYEFVLFRGRKKVTYGNDREIFLKYLDSQIRITVAEFAKSRVFIHAGVVAWNGKAIILPAKSFQGKTSLVKELTKLGAQYYSDEYAILDEEGLVHPFPKTLSIRGIAGQYQQVEFAVESFGGVAGETPLPVGMVFFTEFEKGAKWEPQFLSEGLGVMELLSHTIPIRYNPKFSLKVLYKTVNHAIIVKTKRGEAALFALKLLSFFEKKAF